MESEDMYNRNDKGNNFLNCFPVLNLDFINFTKSILTLFYIYPI